MQQPLNNQQKRQTEEDNSANQNNIQKKQMIIKKQSKYSPLSQLAIKYKIAMDKQLGHGYGSVVYMGTKIHTSQPVCIKIIDYNVLGSQRKLLDNQILYLKNFKDNKYIVQLLDIYQSNSFCYLIMQLCPGGDLYKFIMGQPFFYFPQQASNIIKQICLGLNQIHKQGLIHRDIKTQNILIGQYGAIKIGDLGFCVSEDHTDKQNVGSPIYMSLQVAQKQQYSRKSDIYAVGVIWFQLLQKRAPWSAKNEVQLIQLKKNQQLFFMRTDIPQKDKNLIERCLSNDITSRCTLQQLLQHLN